MDFINKHINNISTGPFSEFVEFERNGEFIVELESFV
jgi:hypothetical protein